ncbi:ATPase family AAA domain-containing protein 2B [Halotydeus destructor]|nr:ATPase family AAA domain-containing protein 2B [Halotydeus destructor]
MMKAKITEESLTDVETVVDGDEPANDKDYMKVKKDELSIMVDNEETENDEKTGNVDRHETEESSESSSESESDDNKRMKLRDRKERAQQRDPNFGGHSARGKYLLRQRRTLARPVQHVVHRAPQGRSRPRAHPFSRQGYVRKHNSLNAPSSSSSSDETHYEKKKAKHMAEARSQCLPMNFKAKDLIHGALRDRQKIYNSKNKLLLNVDEVIVGLRDFNAAIKKIVPATQRSSPSVARPLSSIIKPLLNDLLNTAVMTVKKIFPEAETRVTTDLLDSDDDLEQHLIPPIFHSAEKSSGNMIRWAGNYRPRFLIYGNKDRGHSSHLAPALLHSLEHLAHLKLDASALYSVTARTPEESLAAIFSEALKRLPAVLYIPHIDSFWEILSDTLKVSFVSLLDDLEPSTPLLVLATSEGTVEDLPTELQGVFSRHCCTLKTLFMSLPSRAERETFFEQLFKSYAFKDAEVQKPVELCNEVLPEVVVKDNRKLSDAELKRLKKKEEQALRQLRLFLGEIIIKIMRDRRFQDFLQPVDQADAPDYTDVIKHPMDLELMMAKLDDGQYECAQEFLSDIHLITDNALEYNPCNNTENKKLRHCAVALRDFANALIEAEMDSDFETYCQEMVHSRRDRGEKRPEPVLSVLPPLIVSLNKIEEGDETEVEGESVKVIGDGLSVKGLAIKRKKDDVVENGKRIRRGSKSDDSEANSSKEKVDSTVNDIEKVNGDDVIMIEETQQSIIASSEDVVKIGEKTVQIDEGKLKLVFKRLIDLTEGIAAEKLEQLYWSLFRIMRKHVKRWERLQLPNDLSKELDRFETSLKTIA